MKTKQFLFMMLVFPLLLGTVGCDKPEKENEVPKELIGKWKLKGLGETGSTTLRELEPKDCEKCFTLSFHKDGQYFGWTVSNSIAGKFSVDKKKQIIVTSDFLMTEVAELGDGKLYLDCFRKEYSYAVSNENLKIFYEADKYLLYKKIEL